MEKFDIIIVGAGPAGSAAAYYAAKSGLSVLLLERGEYPGAKNVSGAVFYSDVLNNLIPNFHQEAPIERYINHHVLSALTEDASISVKFSNQRDKPVGISVLRGKFDRWFAGKAEEAGAVVLTASLVEDLIVHNGQVSGVKIARDHGEVYANIVILAEGANSLLTEKAGLRKRPMAKHLGLGIKEVIRLPASEIEKRFQLSANDGVAFSFIGDCTRGIPGGGFLYTNRESISIGVVAHLEHLKRAKVEPFTLLDHFKEHSAVASLIAGGSVKEYAAHLIPEGGLDMVPRIHAGGVMVVGDAAGFTMNYGLVLRGMDFAVASGIAAAEAACKAHEIKDFSKSATARYRRLLRRSFVLKDLRRFKKLSRFLQKERVYTEYPAWLNRVGKSLFDVSARPRDKSMKLIIRERPRTVNLLTIIRDMMRGIKSI